MVGRVRNVALLALLPAMTVQASPTVSTNIAPGGYVTACGGLASSGSPGPGGDLSSGFQAGASDCHTGTFGPGGGATASSADSNGAGDPGFDYSSNAQGAASMGLVKMSVGNSGQIAANFPSGRVTGGWEDHLTITSSDPTLNGKPGTLFFDVSVHAMLDSQGDAGSARLTVDYFKNNQQSFLPGGISGAKEWRISTFPKPDVNQRSLVVDETVHFSVDFNFGTSFDLGVFALASAGMRAQSNSLAFSTAHIDALNTIRWMGVTGVTAGDGTVTDFSIASASGIDWVQPAPVPLPAGLSLLGTVVAGLVAAPRRRRAAA